MGSSTIIFYHSLWASGCATHTRQRSLVRMISFPTIHACRNGTEFWEALGSLKTPAFSSALSLHKTNPVDPAEGVQESKKWKQCHPVMCLGIPQVLGVHYPDPRKPTDWYVLWQKPVICHFFFVVTKDRETSRRSSGQNTSEWITVMCARWFSSSGSESLWRVTSEKPEQNSPVVI